MTPDDAFDARLRAAFQAAEPRDGADFAARIDAGLDADPAAAPDLEALLQRERRRAWVLTAAGALGAGVAVTQLPGLFALVAQSGAEASGALAGAEAGLRQALLHPELLATVAAALLAAGLSHLALSRH